VRYQLADRSFGAAVVADADAVGVRS